MVEYIKSGEIQFPPEIGSFTANDFISTCILFTYSFDGQTGLAYVLNQYAIEKKCPPFEAFLKNRSGNPSRSPGPTTTFLVQSTEMLNEEKIARMIAEEPDFLIFSRAFMDSVIFVPRREFRKRNNISFFFDYDTNANLHLIKVPVLVFVGKFDFVTPLRYAVQVKQLIGNTVQLVVLPTCAHDGFVKETAFVMENIIAFLSGNQLPTLVPPILASFQEVRNARKPVTQQTLLEAFQFGETHMGSILRPKNHK
ncbi:MAG: alpha/beta hydrolase [Candidatus Ozemobacteraceae bacterium]